MKNFVNAFVCKAKTQWFFQTPVTLHQSVWHNVPWYVTTKHRFVQVVMTAS
jgi:hypothetical protein